MALIERRVLTQHVYEAIKRMIEEGVLAPGDRIDRRRLGEQLGVSQTPISEVLNRLAGEKLIYHEIGRGYFVQPYSNRALAELFAVRAAVDGVALRLCAEEASGAELAELCAYFSEFTTPLDESDLQRYQDAVVAFHRAVIRCCRNEPIQSLTSEHGYIIKTLQHGLVRDPNETLMEYRSILDALRTRDADAVQKLMSHHHLKSRSFVRDDHQDAQDE